MAITLLLSVILISKRNGYSRLCTGREPSVTQFGSRRSEIVPNCERRLVKNSKEYFGGVWCEKECEMITTPIILSHPCPKYIENRLKLFPFIRPTIFNNGYEIISEILKFQSPFIRKGENLECCASVTKNRKVNPTPSDSYQCNWEHTSLLTMKHPFKFNRSALRVGSIQHKFAIV